MKITILNHKTFEKALETISVLYFMFLQRNVFRDLNFYEISGSINLTSGDLDTSSLCFTSRNKIEVTDHRTSQLTIRCFVAFSSTLELDMSEAKLMETTSLVLLLLVILLSPIIIFLVKSATSTIQVLHSFLSITNPRTQINLNSQNFAVMLVERTQELKVEKNKSDKLLRQMLPVSVIQQLKQQRQVFIKLADSFNGLANLVQFLINVI